MAKEKLTEERKQQLEELYMSLRRHNFYTILGIGQDATRAEVRKAYFAISRLCHPDNYLESDLGKHQQYMEKIFQACSKAYDVLSNAKKRERYKVYLAKKADTAEYATNVLQQSVDVAKPSEEAEATSSRPAPGGRVVERKASPAPRGSDEILKPLQTPSAPRGGSSQPRRLTPRALDAESAEKHKQRRASWKRSAAKRGLLGAIGNVENMEKAKRGKTWLTQAQKAHEEGETLSAISALRMAVDADPDNEEAKDLMQVVIDGASDELGQRYFEQAKAELEFGEFQLAQVSVVRALEFCPDRPDVLLVAAKVLLETDGDMHKAYGHAQRAAQISAGNADAHLILGKILVKAGLNARAKKVLKTAMEINPKLTEAETILAGL